MNSNMDVIHLADHSTFMCLSEVDKYANSGAGLTDRVHNELVGSSEEATSRLHKIAFYSFQVASSSSSSSRERHLVSDITVYVQLVVGFRLQGFSFTMRSFDISQKTGNFLSFFTI